MRVSPTNFGGCLGPYLNFFWPKFWDHGNSVVKKANRALGLLIRTFQSASPRCNLDKQAVLAAYNANVRSIVEYCSVIWGGAAKCHLVRVERVQHKFLMWLARHTVNDGTSLAYADLLSSFHVSHLGARRAQCDILFLCKVFKGFISSSHLLESFKMHVSARRTRITPLYDVPFARVNTMACGLFVRIPRSANHFLEYSSKSDVFFDSLRQLKKQILAFTSTLACVM